MTEITGSPTVDILGSGEPLPTVALFDSSTPSEFPFVIPDLERFEGMLVGFDGMASSPTNRFGELGVVIDETIFVDTPAPVAMRPRLRDKPLQFQRIVIDLPSNLALPGAAAPSISVRYRILGTDRVLTTPCAPYALTLDAHSLRYGRSGHRLSSSFIS